MNLFRVLASGKQGFREEFASALLAYLLSPKMDHGMGSLFLSRLLQLTAKETDLPELKELADALESRLWEDIFVDDGVSISVELEVPYPTPSGNLGYIDVVVKCNHWFIMVENKIAHGAFNPGQIKEQYAGLKKVVAEKGLSDCKILLIYLVPATGSGDSWIVEQKYSDELDDVNISQGDGKALISWQPASNCSIVGLLKEIIQKADSGSISPISTELRHMLLSVIDFSLGNFSGFAYDEATGKSPASEKMTVRDILASERQLYVGVQYGLAGVITKAWRNPDFYEKFLGVTEKTVSNWQYLPLNTFKKITKWCIDPDNNSLSGMEWAGKPFYTPHLYKVAKMGKVEFFIGAQGGLEFLKSADIESIEERLWEIGETKKTGQWFSNMEFCRVLEEKDIPRSWT